MVGKKTRILAIGGDCNYAPCYKKLIDKNLGRAAVVVDCFDSFEGAYRRLQKSTYDYYLVCSQRKDPGALVKLEEIVTGGYSYPNDPLTGLYNRSYFLKKIRRLNLEGSLPLSFILGKINDLKLVNEVFGYSKGDRVVARTAKEFRNCCFENSIIARWSGNELIAALPNRSSEAALNVVEALRERCRQVEGIPIEINITLGATTQEGAGENITDILKRVEAGIRRKRLTVAKYTRNATIAKLVKLLGEKSYETEEHAWRMQSLGVRFGSRLSLDDSQMEDLVLTITLHDIGKLAVPEQLLMKPGRLTPEEFKVIKDHSVRGYRIALCSNELAHVAPAILGHHERWDGEGYPEGLKGDEIPLLSRIVAIVDSYDVMTHDRPYRKAISRAEAQRELKRCAGSQFDPKLVAAFLELDL
ncbi:MAG: diguanylate cyclase [Firmicutes bacterium]|nr:diguanylate cyclase [Bacillota bacterium]